MRRTGWTLLILLSLALLAAPQALAGQGKGQGNGNQAAGTHGQWVNNQPPGWSGHGQKQGWAKQGSTMPVGLNTNPNSTGKYPKGLQKLR
ncbi:MAG: hypothetical protein NTY36_18080 [Deltaproteobacteria bacterium]|nr:hypothetical protein [Deltaproteobacteria bacterium]